MVQAISNQTREKPAVISDPKHPLWPLVRLSILMLTLVLVLWLQASNFDQTEIKAIILIFLAAAGVEGGLQVVNRKMDKR